ncbi:hypothetical protein TUZN_1158 [Thermoproteus uzoniensis 768-20]|uniref:Uncharacterized protein n=1 Tax=Thermoproteus uzoniensis (strain 768-20) TaxID=999630 RepID=F2L0F5_THEU7|nr:hypothetical protein [Thermoproteus uzoniensis]AEA12637.1 hypothetical protein TUZN_1158 [Thermoproteus uzoniensis 768-20]
MQLVEGECVDVAAVTLRLKTYIQQMVGFLPPNFRVVKAEKDGGVWKVEIYFVYISAVLGVPPREIKAVATVDEKCRILDYREAQ